jgi:hypothetical protein
VIEVFCMVTAEGATPTPGSTAPSVPTNVASFPYGEDFIGIQWGTGTVGATTQVGLGTFGVDPTAPSVNLGSGINQYETGASSGCYYVRHAKDGLFSAWVAVVHPTCTA